MVKRFFSELQVLDIGRLTAVEPMKALVLLLALLSFRGIRNCDSFVLTNGNKVSVVGIPKTVLTAMNQIGDDDVTNSLTATTETSAALLHQILQVAIDASKKAGEIILGNAGGAEVTERKANSRDLLTLIDPLCEKVGFFFQ